ncbi:hypothetical protein A0O36_02881 [Piscirickettsiaceae bacterium NZ-RLO1]|nr:hypothetical protein A0O36_02881 [Piscirickettsiaceae bacterium NZ-RLO1]
MKKIVFYIEQRLSEGDSLRSIARALDFSPSTISREIKGIPQAILTVFIAIAWPRVVQKKKRANAKQGQAFQQITEKAKCIDS